MKQRYLLIGAAIALLLVPIGTFGRLSWLRPQRVEQKRQLFPGIVYSRSARSLPRPVMVHIVTIDLTAPGLRAMVTPRQERGARTTSDFLRQYKLNLAINASYFAPFHERTPWDYYPRIGDRAEAMGDTISNGDRYIDPRSKWPALCISSANIATINDEGTCPFGTQSAVAGRDLLVGNGKPTPEKFADDKDKPYPRVAVGVDRSGTRMWLVIIDGKQPLYSEGLTRLELAKLLVELKIDKAVNLDGGGSTTLVTATDGGTQVLNAPIHAKLPTIERPVANHLGFYFR